MAEATKEKVDTMRDEEEGSNAPQRSNHKCCTVCVTRGPGGWCKKFFWEGQMVNKAHDAMIARLHDDMPIHKRILIKYRRPIGFILPVAFVHFFFWNLINKHDLWYNFKDKYEMTITMIFGGLIAGMTSEGGGAVAFPVMTLVLGISPIVARDFSMMIQASGMSCASFAIFFMKVQVEWSAILFCMMGGWVGLLFGFYIVDPIMTPAQKKMFFSSIWFAFAFTLFLLNRMHKRRTFPEIPAMNWWKALVLLATGLIGGIMTSFAGSGLDICSFSVLTLLFRVSEKVATPTSVVLMAFTSIFGVYWRQLMLGGCPWLAWEYLSVTYFVVTIMAPFGAIMGSHFHRLVLAAFIYFIDTAVIITAFAVVPQTPLLTGVSIGIIVIGFGFFGVLTYMGAKLLDRVEAQERAEAEEDARMERINGKAIDRVMANVGKNGSTSSLANIIPRGLDNPTLFLDDEKHDSNTQL